jgi:hypothetical protein
MGQSFYKNCSLWLFVLVISSYVIFYVVTFCPVTFCPICFVKMQNLNCDFSSVTFCLTFCPVTFCLWHLKNVSNNLKHPVKSLLWIKHWKFDFWSIVSMKTNRCQNTPDYYFFLHVWLYFHSNQLKSLFC